MRAGYGGGIEVICGPMFSGKSEELIRRLRLAIIARQRVQVFKPAIDDRYGDDELVSHSDLRLSAQNVGEAAEIMTAVLDRTDVVGVDEAQFLDGELVHVCESLANRGIRVIAAGLDLDYRGLPFAPMDRLLAVAERVTKLQAVCMVCGAPASRSQRLYGTSRSVVDVGSSDKYEARCRRHFEPEEERQLDLLRARQQVLKVPLRDTEAVATTPKTGTR